MTDDQAKAQLTQLWLDHKASVEAFVWRRCAEDIDDVVQQVFMTAWRRLDDVPDEPRAWLLTVARNTLLNQRRAARRRKALAVRVSSAVDVTADHDSPTDNDHSKLCQAWAELSDPEREILALTAWDGLTTAETAQVLGIARPACAMRLTRARRHLHALLTTTEPPLSEEPAPPPSGGDHHES